VSRHSRIAANCAVANPAAGERRLSTIRPLARRGLSRIEAAMYIGIGVTKFDEMVASGSMPKPKRIDGRRVWDIIALDMAFDALPEESATRDDTWNDIDGA
jgi:predicted DNA-binding transcriptional regulator AlpA